MNAIRRWTAIFAVLVCPLLMSCGDSASPFRAPVPGTLVVFLEASGTPAGAVLVVVHGKQIGVPVGVHGGGTVFARAVDTDAGQWQVAVVGSEVTGKLFSFDVPDVNRPEAYSAELIQVADRADNLLPDIAGYRVSIQPKR